MAILIFFLVLFALILVHEWGHFIVAKKTGMRVDEFGIGFPPKLFGIKKGETEYTFNLLPIGGFVRIFGENALDAKEVEDAVQHGENISASFTSKSKWAQAAVLIAGVTMNIIFAWFLFLVVFMIGVPTAVTEQEATDNAELTVIEVLPQSPASEAGIPVGAVVHGYSSTQDTETLTPSGFREASMGDAPLALEYEFEGQMQTVEVSSVSGLTENSDQKAIGVALALVETVRKPIHLALYDATIMTVTSLGAITTGIFNLFVDIAQMDADLSQVAGPVGIVGLVGDAADFGLASLMMFTAIISLNLAVINLLPVPALDGGRLVFVAIESITRKPINPVWVNRLNTIGFILLMALMFAVTYSDIAKII